MTDWVALQLIVSLVTLIAVVLAISMIRFVPTGKLGFVFLFGAYKRTIQAGFNVVPVFSRVRYISPGSGFNGVLGLVGTSETALSVDGPVGSVSIGGRTLPARSARKVTPGASIRVIEDGGQGPVLVAREYPTGTQHDSHPGLLESTQ